MKFNLSLPAPENPEPGPPEQKIIDAGGFRAALMNLDKTIIRFVTNPLFQTPIFQTPSAIEITRATQARRDLELVIDLTADRKKIASRLEKSVRSPILAARGKEDH